MNVSSCLCVRRGVLVTLVALWTAVGPALAQAPDSPFPEGSPESVGMSSEKLREAMDSVRAWVGRDRIRGATLLVVKDGKQVFHESAGWSDRERGVPLRTDHIVSMRSMTKPLVGTAALMLVEEGKLRLEDRVSKYLPSFDNERSREITLFQLLTHTSGITGEIYNDRDGTPYRTLREAVDAVGARGPSLPPGMQYSYSDPGTSTLGTVIAQVSGMPVEDFIQRRIIEPLGMKDSYLLLPTDAAMRSRVAATYRKEEGKWVRYWDNTQPMIVPFFRASGGLWSTSLDYARFMTMMLHKGRFGEKQLIQPATVALAIQPHNAYVYPPERQRERDRFYGLHWSVYSDRYRPVSPPFSSGIFEHAGSDGTLAWADPSHNLIFIYLTQSRGHDTRNDFVRLLYAALEDPRAPSPAVPLSTFDFRLSTSVADLLLLGGHVLDGAGNPWMKKDVAITGDRISFVGNARHEGVTARDTLNVSGLLVTPGLWDVHSHAELGAAHGKVALPILYQGVTTVVLGVDGDGPSNVAEIFQRYRDNGIAVNAVRYVGHGAARSAVMGPADRRPTADELERMKAFIRKGMDEGAVGLSTGLFYSPGYFADTDEVVELAKVAAEYGGSYDTHDRDLGVAYKGIGYLASIREGIEIGERAGTPVIFSHFNAQGVQWYGRAAEGAKLIDDARARGVNVVAGQHVYTATNSSLVAYALPRWAVVGGRDEMVKRFRDPATRARLEKEIVEMLEPRGGPAKIQFSDSRRELNGKTLAEVAKAWNLSIPATVMRIAEQGNASVMNLDLYDEANTRYLAQKEWMMTCTDGYTPRELDLTSHPRSYGSFTRKLRVFALDEGLISLPFAIRGMTSLPAAFYGFTDRGLIAEGQHADIAVFDVARIRDRTTYQNPHQYSEGTVHVLVNGKVAFRDGKPTGALAGRPLPRQRGQTM